MDDDTASPELDPWTPAYHSTLSSKIWTLISQSCIFFLHFGPAMGGRGGTGVDGRAASCARAQQGVGGNDAAVY